MKEGGKEGGREGGREGRERRVYDKESEGDKTATHVHSGTLCSVQALNIHVYSFWLRYSICQHTVSDATQTWQ